MKMKSLLMNIRDIAATMEEETSDVVREAVNDLNELADRLQDEGIDDKKPKKKKKKK